MSYLLFSCAFGSKTINSRSVARLGSKILQKVLLSCFDAHSEAIYKNYSYVLWRQVSVFALDY